MTKKNTTNLNNHVKKLPTCAQTAQTKRNQTKTTPSNEETAYFTISGAHMDSRFVELDANMDRKSLSGFLPNYRLRSLRTSTLQEMI